MTCEVTVRHNFETAHRVPVLGGKCRNLHGHSWWCEITVSALEAPNGTVVQFGPFKAGVRAWIDTHLDHGTMLKSTDPLVQVLTAEGCKVFRFGAEDPSVAEQFATRLPWPTVESVAELLCGVANEILTSVEHAETAVVSQVKVQETHINTACFQAPPSKHHLTRGAHGIPNA